MCDKPCVRQPGLRRGFRWLDGLDGLTRLDDLPQLDGLACVFGSPTWARTRDLRINSPALYQLSYRGKFGKLLKERAF